MRTPSIAARVIGRIPADVREAVDGRLDVVAAVAIISALPNDGCLLMDDPLSCLDTGHRDRLLHAAMVSNGQVILTAEDRLVPGIRQVCGRQAHLLAVPRLPRA